MIPSSKWFPSSLGDRADWYANFNTQLGIGTMGTSLGLSAADMTTIGDDNSVMQFLSNSAAYFEAYMDGVREYRKTITEGKIGDAPPVFPTFVSPGTVTAVPTGIFERLDQFVKRIRASPAYTPETGALLAIIPQKGDDLVESELKPALKASAMPGNVVEIEFVRGKTAGINIETNIDGAGWTFAAFKANSPATLNIPNGTGNPHSVQLRARYVLKDEPVGLNSDTVNVVTTP